MIQIGARVFLLISGPLLANGFATLGAAKGVAFSSRINTYSASLPADLAQSVTSLRNVIRGLDEEDLIDEGLGGVTLAIESAILVSGQYDKSADEFSLNDLTRYTELTEIKDSSLLQSSDSNVIGAGGGDECYYDPGENTYKQIDFAPIVAATEAVKSISTGFGDISSLSVNILGGDELVINEAVDGALEVVRNMIDLPSNCKVSMTSLCTSSIPATSASVTLVAGSGNGKGSTGIERGYIYQHKGKLWTVQEENLETKQS
jgi:hypothetical protein